MGLIPFDLKALFFAIPLAAALLAGALLLQPAHAQFQSGGVDKDGEWYAGESLGQGDYFSYRMCHVDYKECATFQMDFWFKGDIRSGTEDKWLVEVVVYDGIKRVVGQMELGKLAPEPTGGTQELGIYRGAFKSSIVWLTAFATEYGEGDEGPKAFRDPSWGKIANIGGEQVRPTAIESVTVPEGTWDDTVLVSWKTGGKTSKVWVADEFPFPIKAHTFTHVSEGIPPLEYKFELLDYKTDIQKSPFEGIVSSQDTQAALGCPQYFEKVSVKKPSKNFQYQIHVFYGPEYPMQGCEIQWQINFINKFDDTEFLNQVQYDLLVVDEELKPSRSIAQEEGRKFLYSPSGQAVLDMVVNEEPGITRYAVWIYGLAPDYEVPSQQHDYVEIEIPISEPRGETASGASIPSWVKTSAGWWADGLIDDNSFVQGIQYLIQEGIMTIPATAPSTGAGNSQIPSWVKTNAGWWADGLIDNNSFVQGIQYLIKEGIMKIPAQTATSTSDAPPSWLG